MFIICTGISTSCEVKHDILAKILINNHFKQPCIRNFNDTRFCSIQKHSNTISISKQVYKNGRELNKFLHASKTGKKTKTNTKSCYHNNKSSPLYNFPPNKCDSKNITIKIKIEVALTAK